MNATKFVFLKDYEALGRQGHRSVGTRWVITRKPDRTIKRRLDAQSCQERRLILRRDAPTGSALTFYLTLAYAAQLGLAGSL